MSQRYSIAEARANLPTIVDQAEAELTIELTRRGKAVAVIVSLLKFELAQGNRPRFGKAYKRFLAKHSPAEIGLDDDFSASVRDSTNGCEVRL